MAELTVRPRSTVKTTEEGQAPLKLGLYRGKGTGDLEEFNIYLGRARDFLPRLEDTLFSEFSELVRIDYIPPHVRNDMQLLLSKPAAYYPPDTSLVYVGGIRLGISNDGVSRLARTEWYFPKHVFTDEPDVFPNGDMGRAAPGFGFAAEFRILTILIREGITHVLTPYYSSPERKAQVEGVGLTFGAAIPIDEWLIGMLRGYRKSIRKASHATAQPKSIYESAVERPYPITPEYCSQVKEELLRIVGEMGLQPHNVVFSGYGTTPKAIEATTGKKYVSFAPTDFLDWRQPDVRYNNPIAFAARDKSGVIGIYDYDMLKRMGISPGAFGALTLPGTVDDANKAKLAELHLRATE